MNFGDFVALRFRQLRISSGTCAIRIVGMKDASNNVASHTSLSLHRSYAGCNAPFRVCLVDCLSQSSKCAWPSCAASPGISASSGTLIP
jgi:hypothetical protein